MTPRRYRAPHGDGALLAEPAFDPAAVAANRAALDGARAPVGGVPLRDLRRQARAEVLALAQRYLRAEASDRPAPDPDAPLLLAGHQPELFHPGVWVKNFALAGAAARAGGAGLQLVADHDTVKSTSVRFPNRVGGPPEGVRTRPVPFDRFEGAEPYETRRARDPELFASFAGRARPLWEAWGFEPLLTRVWPDVLATDAGCTLGERFSRVRRLWERRWGCFNWELPVSRLSRTAAWGHFVQHIVSDHGRFRECYNRAVRRYRELHGISSANHPVPDLASGELPFWGAPDADGRRRRPTLADAPAPAELRPRALTLTLFARLIVGDFFVHGIGGGKYDELTDSLIADFFGVEPPAFQVVTGSLRLPLPGYEHDAEGARRAARRERDLIWAPRRPSPEEVVRPADAAGRRAWYRRLRELREASRPAVAAQLAEATATRRLAEEEARANAVLRRRDYAWVLFPEAKLRPFLTGAMGG